MEGARPAVPHHHVPHTLLNVGSRQVPITGASGHVNHFNCDFLRLKDGRTSLGFSEKEVYCRPRCTDSCLLTYRVGAECTGSS